MQFYSVLNALQRCSLGLNMLCLLLCQSFSSVLAHVGKATRGRPTKNPGQSPSAKSCSILASSAVVVLFLSTNAIASTNDGKLKSVAVTSEDADKKSNPSYFIGWNVVETANFVAANAIVAGDQLIFLPFHIDAAIPLANSVPNLSLGLGLVYRYEHYFDRGPEDIWYKQHEFFVLAGPRYSFGEGPLGGFYLEGRIGPGYTTSPAYRAVTLLIQPEIGYAWTFGSPGFYLGIGTGVLLNFPLWQSQEVLSFSGDNRLNLTGWLVHQTIPILNLTLGVGI